MKTAISIPNEVFASIEKYSKIMKVSRSRILSDAARYYISTLDKQHMKAALDDVYPESANPSADRKYLEHFAKSVLKETTY